MSPRLDEIAGRVGSACSAVLGDPKVRKMALGLAAVAIEVFWESLRTESVQGE